jgi:DNA-binding Lrp family transcriptional regulator
MIALSALLMKGVRFGARQYGGGRVEAYVLIQAKPGPAGQGVSKEVGTIKGIISAEDVSGPYDVIARAQARNLDEFARVVVAGFNSWRGVTRTLACPVVHLE